MNNMKLFFIGLFSVFLIQLEAQNELDFDAIAMDVCECSTEITALKIEMDQIIKEGENPERMEAFMKKYEPKAIEFGTCIDKLAIKYPELDKNDANEKKAEQALIKNCPDLAEMMGLKPMVIHEGDEIMLEEMDVIEEQIITEDIQLEEGDIAYNIEEEYNEAYFEDFSNSVCNCIDESNGLWQAYQKVQANGDNEKINSFRNEINRNYPEYQKCFTKLMQDYKGLDGSEEAKNKAVKALEVTCPKFIELSGAK